MGAITMDGVLAELGRNSVQAGLLVLAVLLAQWLTGRRLSPRWRCALWLVVVGRLLVPFSFGSVANVFNLLPHRTKAAPVPIESVVIPASNVKTISEPVATTTPTSEQAEIPLLNPVQVQSQPNLSVSTPVSVVTPISVNIPSPAFPVAPSFSWSWPVCLFCIWLSGVIGLLGHVLLSSLRLGRRCAKLRPLMEPTTTTLLQACRENLEVRTPLVLVETVEVNSPALHGLFRPRLLLPKGFTSKFTAAELRFVFLHELAHLKRRDLWMNWVILVLQAVHWFNPLVWLGFARWRADRELACDAMVLEATGAEQNKKYGETILHLLENFTHPLRTPGLVGILEDKKQLRRRIGMIAGYVPAPRWSMLAMLLLAGLTMLGLTDARSDDSTKSSIISATTTGLRLTVELRDGSRVTGKNSDEIWRFRSASLGEIQMPPANIRTIESVGKTEKVRLTTANGDALDVQFVATALDVETSFGKTELPVKLIKQIRIAATKANWGSQLIGWWKLDDGSGTIAKDSSLAQSPQNGLLVNGPTWTQTDRCECLRFDGNQYVSLGNILHGAYEEISIACWIKHGSSQWQNVVERGSWDQADGIGLMMDYNTTSVSFGHYSDMVKSKANVQDDSWHFVVGTMIPNDSGYIYSIYVDGKLDNSEKLTRGLSATESGWAIGARYDGTWGYQGLINNVQIFDRALSPIEVMAMYQQTAMSSQPSSMPTRGSSILVLEANESDAVAITKKTNLRLNIEIRDGSRVVGESVERRFKFQAALLGDLKLDVKDVSSIEWGSTNVAKATTINGDVLTVSLADAALEVITGFGKVELPVASIRSLKVISLRSSGLPLFNIDFGPGRSDTSKQTGPAAVGNEGDFWNSVSVGFNDDHTESGLKFADGQPSPIRARLINLGGGWGNEGKLGVKAPMLDSFNYPVNNQGGNSQVILSQVPPGTYTLYVYGHGSTPLYFGDYAVSVGSHDYGRKKTTTGNDAVENTEWAEGSQYVVFPTVTVGEGENLEILIRPGGPTSAGGGRIVSDAMICGLQLVPVR